MKKYKLILIMIFSIFISFKVDAKEVTVTTGMLENIYSNRQLNSVTYWGKFGYIYVDGKIGYCVDPTHIISSSIYSSSNDFSSLNISNETLSKIEDYAYYGYGYDNHLSNEYYMATQSLIWEALDNYNVYFTTKSNRSGDIIDISSYKYEILNTIASNNNIPKIPTVINGKVGEKSILDENISLKDYELVNSDDQVKIENGKLNIKFLNEGTKEYVLKKKIRDNDVSILFQSPNSQTVSLLGITNKQDIKFKVTSIPLKKAIIRIYKRDGITKNLVQGTASFKIKNLDTGKYISNEEIDVFKTNALGLLELNFELVEGNYRLEEIEAPYGYFLNDNFFDFSIKDDSILIEDKYLDFDFFDMPILCSLKIIKKDSLSGKFLKDAKFNVLDEFGNIITSISTDENGEALVDSLRYGKYYIQEIEAPEGYLKDDLTKLIEINNEKVEFEFLNTKVIVPDTTAEKNSFVGVIGTIIIGIGVFFIKCIKKI